MKSHGKWLGLASMVVTLAYEDRAAAQDAHLAALDAMRLAHNGLSGQVHGDPPLCGVNSENTACCEAILSRRHDAIEGIARLAREGAFSGRGDACASWIALRGHIREVSNAGPQAEYLDGPNSPPIRCQLPALRVPPLLRASLQRLGNVCRAS